MPAAANLVHQTSTTTGTGNFTLSTVNGKQSFDTAFGHAATTNVFDYFISNQAAAEWERGTGHMSDATTLVRDTVLEGTNGTSPVSFSAGLKDICNDIPAAKQVSTDGTQTLTNKTLTNPIVGTQSQGDNSTKAASTAYVDRTTREVLTANRTYYVRTDGSNSNNGLANTSGGAFLTIQKAIDTACALDLSVYAVTINVADGTYSGFVLKNYIGVGPISIVGNTTTPANVDLSGASTNVMGTQWGCTYSLSGVKIANSAGNGMRLTGPGTLNINNMEFGACSGAHIRADNSCFVTCTTGALTISGNAAYGYLSGYLSLINLDSSTVTYTANVAYSQAHCYSQLEGVIHVPAVTWTLGGNTVTGKRYNAYANATINTNGGGANAIPGDVAGTTTGDGAYN